MFLLLFSNNCFMILIKKKFDMSPEIIQGYDFKKYGNWATQPLYIHPAVLNARRIRLSTFTSFFKIRSLQNN